MCDVYDVYDVYDMWCMFCMLYMLCMHMVRMCMQLNKYSKSLRSVFITETKFEQCFKFEHTVRTSSFSNSLCNRTNNKTKFTRIENKRKKRDATNTAFAL